MTRPRAAVIGGGAAGLAAASRLLAFDVDLSLLEADAAPGGVIHSIRHGGWLAEAGPHLLAAVDPGVRALLDASGLASALVRPAPVIKRNYVVHRGVPVPLPVTVAELSSTPLLSVAGRLRFARDLVMGAGPRNDEESVDSFARRRFGDEVAERLFDPRVTGTAGGDATQLLARHAFPAEVRYERERGSVLRGSIAARLAARRRASRGAGGASGGFQDGMQLLPSRLAERLGRAVRTAVPVRAVRAIAGGFDVVASDGSAERFDAVLLAVPSPALGRIAIAAPGADRLGQVAAIPHAPMAAISLGFRREDVAHPLDGYRLLVPSGEQRMILSVVFASSILPDRAPADHVLLTAYLGGMRRSDLVSRPDAELAHLARIEMRDLLGAHGDPAFTSVTVCRGGLPQAVAGHDARLATADAIEAEVPALAFAGSWRDGVALSDVLSGGVRAAERLAERCRWTSTVTPA